MKRIINNRKYDTETAIEIGKWESSEHDRLHYVEETLYRKRTGEYFVFGRGGAGSCYAEYRGNRTYVDGESITPLDLVDAQNWAAANLSVDAYEAEFGEVAE